VEIAVEAAAEAEAGVNGEEDVMMAEEMAAAEAEATKAAAVQVAAAVEAAAVEAAAVEAAAEAEVAAAARAAAAEATPSIPLSRPPAGSECDDLGVDPFADSGVTRVAAVKWQEGSRGSEAAMSCPECEEWVVCQECRKCVRMLSEAEMAERGVCCGVLSPQ
jgi:hypothetical protein